MIEIHELTKYYGERKGVGPLSFRIEKGEVIGLLGLNGAGKTTTLRMLASDLLPTAGRIMVAGIDLVDEPEKVRPKIGYLPDRPPLYPEMVVREYLQFAGKLRKMKSGTINKRVEEVIDITDLRDHAELRIDTGLAVYFCDPQSPWQRGTNENTNGLLRQYFPKGTDLTKNTSDDLDAVAAALNSRPRKSLGWKTPAEALDHHLRSLQHGSVATTP